MKTSKPIGYPFKTVIMLLQDTVSIQADEKPSVVRVYRNNVLVTEFDSGPTIEDWDNGYLLSFTTAEEVGDIFYCEVDVEKNEEIRIYRDWWTISEKASDDIDLSVVIDKVEETNKLLATLLYTTQIEIVIVDNNNNIVSQAEVYISTDPLGVDNFSGPFYSNDFGIIKIDVVKGVLYYFWANHPTAEITNPKTIKVELIGSEIEIRDVELYT